MFASLGIISKQGDARVSRTLHDLVAFLETRSVRICLDPESARLLPGTDYPVRKRDELGRHCQLIVVVGGDGTFLSTARALVDHDVRMLGVNLGRLGFLTDLTPDAMTTGLGEVLDGDFVEDQRLLLELRVERDGELAFESRALNDVAACSTASAPTGSSSPPPPAPPPTRSPAAAPYCTRISTPWCWCRSVRTP